MIRALYNDELNPTTSLLQLAIARGIQPEYIDNSGRTVAASAETIQAILDALAPVPERELPPTIVLTEGEELPETLAALKDSEVELEDSGDRPTSRVPLSARLPLGYHRLHAKAAGGPISSHLIVCPARVWEPAQRRRRAGIAITLYSLRSSRNWGCGDLRDLRQFITWASDQLGAAFVALNPLHAIHNRQPYNTSPYLPLSTYYRNFLYLDVENVSGFDSCREELPGAQAELEELRSTPFVEYERVAALKLRFLRRSFAACEAEGQPEAFEAFRRREGELLERFCLYSALDEYFRRTRPGTWLWTEWPEEYRHPESEACRQFAANEERELRFHAWLQWQLDLQIEAAQVHARGCGMEIGLLHDLALATDRYGCDLWSSPAHFVAGCRVGAPPDGFSPEGQDWSFPPPDAAAHLADGYRLFRASVRQNAKHGGALRIDHVMRFFRLYWIPEGHTPRDGAYVSAPWKDLLGVLALESHRMKVRIIGEDLGTITGEMRDALTRYGLIGYKVLYFERNWDGSFRSPAEYAQQAVATITTHDLPTLAGFWSGRDIEARQEAGLLSSQEVFEAQSADRAGARRSLAVKLAELGLISPEDARRLLTHSTADLRLLSGVVGLLSSTPCELLSINQEDLSLDPEQQNLPGSTWQHPNWRRKGKFSLEELAAGEAVEAEVKLLRAWLSQSGRGPAAETGT